MRKLISLLTLLFFHIICFGQTTDLGKPKTWSSKHKLNTVTIEMPAVNLQEQLQIDSLNYMLTQSKVYRFGYEHHVEIDVFSFGTSTFSPNGNRFTSLGILCPEAISINLIFDVFELARGTTLYLYNKEQTRFIGAYAAANNNQEKVLGTELLYGEELIIEIIEPKESIGKSKLTLGTVVHGYRDLAEMIQSSDLMKTLNTSGNCNHDVNCPAGSGWEQQKNSVALIISGGSFCSGALVHNTSGVVIPYFLTARHCGTSSIGSWVFRFRWEAPSNGISCATSGNSTDGPKNMTINGSVLRASNSNTDFTLVELNSEPDPQWGIFYAGWDNSDTETITQSVGIHHPRGDIKKICVSNMIPNKTTMNFNGNPSTRMWNVPSWSLGTTEQGSSGSPMFNQDKRIVGTLSGGAAACSGTINNGQYDVYGRFGIAWDEAASQSAQLKHWLDPNNTGSTIIDGFDPGAPIYEVDAAIISVGKASGVICSKSTRPEVTLLNNGTLPLTSARINYIMNGNAGHFDWLGNLETSQSELITLPNLATLEGENTLVVTVTNPNNTTDQNPSNDSRTANFLAAGSGEHLTMELNFDCYAEETSWRVIDDNNTVWYFGENYENQGNTSQTITENFCLTEGCYTLIVEDEYGDGMKGSVFSQCSFDGSMTLTRDFNNALIADIDETNVEFGDDISFDFCVDNITNVSSYDLTNLISIYPNPTENQFTLTYEGELNGAQYLVYSVSGAIISQGNLTNTSTLINVANYKQGVYFVRISSPNGVAVKKLVVGR